MDKDETPVEGDEEVDADEVSASDTASGSDSDAPLIKPRPKAPANADDSVKKSASQPQSQPPPPSQPQSSSSSREKSMSSSSAAAATHAAEPVVANVPGTDDEASEDNEHELRQWEQIDMKPAIDLIDNLTKTCVESAKSFNASVVATTHQLVTGCDSVLLEIKHISDIRENMKRKSASAAALPASTLASHALGTSMLPLSVAAAASSAPLQAQAAQPALDKGTEDQTDRVLYKIEASIEKFRELAEMIQTTSVNHEAQLLQKLKVPASSVQTMVTSIHNAAAAATSSAIAQDRHRLISRTFTSDQRTKLQTWYYSYPRPLADELELMSSILSYPPYSTSPLATIHPQHVRDWFKRRRFRERMRAVMQAVETGTPLNVAEADVRARMELRIQSLREAVNPDELVRELEHVRLSSSVYSTVATSFGNKRNLDQFMTAAQGIAAHDMVKKPRQAAPASHQSENDMEDAVVVKVASKFEVEAIQVRLRSLLKAPKTTANTNSIQQAMDVLRSLEISKELMESSGLVSDLKRVLKVYKKPSLLRRTTETLMESFGQSAAKKAKRPPANNQAATPPPQSLSASEGPSSEKKPSSSSRRKKGAKLHRPMKFSMMQVEALEAWFQRTFKPTPADMEQYLDALNAPPLRDPKQTVDVNMTQLRRWFNKRRCLRRPPHALLTKDKKEGEDDATQEDDEEDDDDDEEDDDDDDETKSNTGSVSTATGGGAASATAQASDDDDDNDSSDISD